MAGVGRRRQARARARARARELAPPLLWLSVRELAPEAVQLARAQAHARVPMVQKRVRALALALALALVQMLAMMRLPARAGPRAQLAQWQGRAVAEQQPPQARQRPAAPQQTRPSLQRS